MKFEVNKYYTHEYFIDVYFKIVSKFDDDNYHIFWYNKNLKYNFNLIGDESIKIINKQGYKQYAF